MIIHLTQFGGMAPRIPPRQLPQQMAQIAKNVDLTHGDLRPLPAPSFVSDLSKVGDKKTIYLFGDQYWWHWLDDVDCVRGPIPNDATERTYWTGDSVAGKPACANADTFAGGGGTDYPVSWLPLGIPAPANIPTLAVSGTATSSDQSLIETRSYVYTYVSDWGEEGPPSNPASIDVAPGQTVDISNMSTTPGSTWNITSKRIYRTNTGDTSTEFQFVAEIPAANSTYADAILDDALGEVLPSTDWIAPPTSMIGLCSMANGILAGFNGQDILFCEAYLPHAWPVAYRLTVDYEIVAQKAYETNLVIATKGDTFVATGTDPSSMSLSRLPVNQSCANKRGMVAMGRYGVVWPSPDGMMSVGPSGIQNLTDPFMSRDDWQAMKPDTIIGFAHNGRYIGFYNDGTDKGFFLDPDPAGFGFTQTDLVAAGGLQYLKDDNLYLIINNQVQQWKGGAALTYTWRSKIFQDGYYSNPGAARVVFDTSTGNSLTFRLYADGAKVYEGNPASGAPFTLPGNYLATEFEIELEGTATVKEASVAPNVGSLGALQ